MAKKKSKKKLIKKNNQAKPSPLQIKAIERLWDKGDKEQALSSVEKLLKIHPKFPLLYSHGIALYQELDQPEKAKWIAFRWTEASPNSIQAWQSLLSLCMKAGHFALVHEGIQRYNHLAERYDEKPILNPSLEAIENELLAIRPDNSQAETMEDVLLFDKGKLLMDAGQWQASLPYFEETSHYPPSANNYALALFQMGCINDALKAYHIAFSREADNLYAMTAYIRLLVWDGQMHEANAYADKLKHARPVRPLYVEAQLVGLAFMERYDDAYSCYQRLSPDDISHMEATFFHLAASIAFRVNEKELARKIWLNNPSKHNRGGEQNPLSLLSTSEEKRRNPGIFTSSELIPIHWVTFFNDSVKASLNDDEIMLRIEKKIPSYPSLDYFKLSYESVQDSGLFVLEFILAAHAKHGDQEAKQVLLSFLKSHRTDLSYKMDLLKRLRSQSIIQVNDKLDYWNGRTTETLQTLGFHITYEAMEEDISSQDRSLYHFSLHNLKKRKVKKAYKVLEALSKKYPHAKTIRGNATAALALFDKEKAIEEYATLVEEFPDYIFARCMLAKYKIDAGELEEALPLLKNVLPNIQEIHVEDYLLLQGTSAYLQAAKGERKAVNKFIESMQHIVKDESDEIKLNYWKKETERMLRLGY
ncbi:MAG: hypothetical protein HAW67_00135 [Endozoicomonadaceae bacterium]|nr:hypothetical protein [Endozoicomonadaceae bacterium]